MDKTLSLSEAVELLRSHPDKIRAHIASGALPPLRTHANEYCFSTDELEEQAKIENLDEPFLTLTEAAQFLGENTRNLMAWCRREVNPVPYYKLGTARKHRLLFRKSELKKWSQFKFISTSADLHNRCDKYDTLSRIMEQFLRGAVAGEVLSAQERDILYAAFVSGNKRTQIAHEQRVSRESVRRLFHQAVDRVLQFFAQYVDHMAQKEKLDRALREEQVTVQTLREQNHALRQENRKLRRQYDLPSHEKVELDDELITILALQVDELELSTRAHNALRKAGIQTLKEITKLKRHELHSMSAVGAKTVFEIEVLLQGFGLNFDMKW